MLDDAPGLTAGGLADSLAVADAAVPVATGATGVEAGLLAGWPVGGGFMGSGGRGGGADDGNGILTGSSDSGAVGGGLKVESKGVIPGGGAPSSGADRGGDAEGILFAAAAV